MLRKEPERVPPRPSAVFSANRESSGSSAFARCNSTNLLPPIYQSLADAPKASRLQTLQDALDDAADAISYGRIFVATPNLLKKVMTLSYVLADPDKLEDGIHHFTVTRQTPAQQHQLQQRAIDYGLILNGTGAPALTDVQVLTAPDSIGAPTRLEDTKQTFENFVMLLTVLLGAQHPQTRYNQILLTSLRQKMHRLDNIMATDATHVHLPAVLLRRPQVEFSDWAESQLRSNAPIPPDMTLNVVNQAAMNIMSWAVPLPPGYLTTVPAHPSRAGGTGSGTSGGSGGSSNPGRGSGSTPGAGSGAPDRSMILNTQPDSRFDRFRERRVKSRVIKQRCIDQNIALPKRANGSTRCLPFHIVNRCNNSCNCRADHVHDHTDAEQEELVQWCDQHWTAGL